MLRAPAAPAPNATNDIEIIEFKKEIFVGDVNKPTAQVKITKDITRGFISCKKDLIKTNKLRDADFLFKVLLVTFTLR
tara:strand:- start:415 stop:648 length:234 start_codon:yes stop_codon:yes gene_type:complete